MNRYSREINSERDEFNRRVDTKLRSVKGVLAKSNMKISEYDRDIEKLGTGEGFEKSRKDIVMFEKQLGVLCDLCLQDIGLLITLKKDYNKMVDKVIRDENWDDSEYSKYMKVFGGMLKVEEVEVQE